MYTGWRARRSQECAMASSLSRERATLNCVGGPAAISVPRCLFTSHTFSNFQCHFKFTLRCLKENYPAINLFVLPFDKVLVSHVTSAIFWDNITLYFGSTLEMSVDNCWQSVYIYWGSSGILYKHRLHSHSHQQAEASIGVSQVCILSPNIFLMVMERSG
jgi:hypothetical protein